MRKNANKFSEQFFGIYVRLCIDKHMFKRYNTINSMNGMMAVTKKEQVRIIAGLFSPAGVIAAVRRLDIRIIHAILAAVLLIALTGIGGRMIIANASVKEGQNALERYYTSITIEDCDTLWDIEARYNTGAENKEQYIRSIMQMNHMSSDILYSGQNLIIYYYGQPQTN